MTNAMQQFLDEVDERLTPKGRGEARRLASEARAKLATLTLAFGQQDETDLNPFTVGEVTDEWLDGCIQRDNDQKHLRAKMDVLTSFIKQAEDQAQALRPNVDAVLAEYHQRLYELLDETADIAATLGDIDTAEAAIAAGQAEQWQRLTELASDYRDLRRAQNSKYGVDLVRAARPAQNHGDDHTTDLYIRNLDEIWPGWREPKQSIQFVGQTGRTVRNEPWPATPTQLLLWLATSKAEAWIPTASQVQQLWEQRRRNANPMPEPRTKRPNVGAMQAHRDAMKDLYHFAQTATGAK